VSRTLQLEGITFLRIAIERARTVKLIQESSFEQRKKNVNVEGRGKSKNNNNFNNFNQEGRDHYKEFKSNIKVKEGKFDKTKFERNKNNERKGTGNEKECWECGKKAHFRLE